MALTDKHAASVEETYQLALVSMESFHRYSIKSIKLYYEM